MLELTQKFMNKSKMILSDDPKFNNYFILFVEKNEIWDNCKPCRIYLEEGILKLTWYHQIICLASQTKKINIIAIEM